MSVLLLLADYTAVGGYYVSDSFDRANGSLGTSDAAFGGSTRAWNVLSGTWTIASNKATATTGVNTYGFATLDARQTNMVVQATITKPTGLGSSCGITARQSDNSNAIMMICYRNVAGTVTQYIVGKLVAGVETYYRVQATPAPADGDVIKIECIGREVNFYVNGTLFHSELEEFNYGATQAGLETNNSPGSTFDDFKVTRAAAFETDWITSDSFNRADGALSGASDGYGVDAFYQKYTQNWSVHSGTFTIASKKMTKSGAAYGFATLPLDSADHTVECEVRTIPTNNNSEIGICARFVDVNNNFFFFLNRSSTGAMEYYAAKMVAGVETYFTHSGTPTAGDVMKIECKGSVVNYYVNGTLFATTTDTAYDTATRGGIMGYGGPGAELDNLKIKTPRSVLVHDSFARINGSLDNSLTGSTVGTLGSKAWTNLHGTWNITSQVVTGTGTAYNSIVIDHGKADQEVQCVITRTTASSTGVGLCARVTDNNNLYALYQYNTGGGVKQWYLTKVVAGVETVLAGPLTSPTPADGDILTLKCVGSTISAYVNGSQIASVTDTTFATQTKAGLVTYGNSNGTQDEFNAFDATTNTANATVNVAADVAAVTAITAPSITASVDDQGLAAVAGVTAIATPTITGDVSVSPSSVDGVTAVGTPAVTADVSVSPSSVDAITAIDNAAFSAPMDVSPSSVDVVAAIDQPTIVGAVDVSSSAVPAVADVGTPTITADTDVSATSVDAVADIQAPSVELPIDVVVPAEVAAVAAVDAPDITASADAVVSEVAAVANVGTPDLNLSLDLAVNEVTATTAIDAVVITASVEVFPETVEAIADPEVSPEGPDIQISIQVDAGAVSGTTSIGQPTILGAASGFPTTTVRAITAITAPTIQAASVRVTPDVVVAVARVPQPTAASNLMTAATGVVAIGTPVIQTGLTVQPDPVAAVAHVTRGGQYHARVRARNTQGYGEPAEAPVPSW